MRAVTIGLMVVFLIGCDERKPDTSVKDAAAAADKAKADEIATVASVKSQGKSSPEYIAAKSKAESLKKALDDARAHGTAEQKLQASHDFVAADQIVKKMEAGFTNNSAVVEAKQRVTDTSSQLAKAKADEERRNRPWNWPDSYDPKKKTDREKLVSQMMSGTTPIFSKLSPGDLTGKAVITRNFYRATYEEKQQFAFIAFCWCLDQNPETIAVSLRDPMTNKEVGEFAWPGGGFSWK